MQWEKAIAAVCCAVADDVVAGVAEPPHAAKERHTAITTEATSQRECTLR
jgi:hypothetical protein